MAVRARYLTFYRVSLRAASISPAMALTAACTIWPRCGRVKQIDEEIVGMFGLEPIWEAAFREVI
ncbi:hypothetical protein D2E76_27960 [Mycobacteroides abscessus]|uniref:Uncharacterized protein n=1 Tax=Mycobacteroides abscessus TaxID=36809 RepID=A0ABD7HG26_9MYCO|nr:hypothetical protein D2E45_00035 [Mycobacteroides abscessus]RIS77738.1 hypothetical protein D2E44_25240 [Mycobacteroides abscessus]RIT26342.1 hypothetical protein D2E76_27960 [Mycobacteroides abscessus]